jgi:type IV pilus assembly protein PilW
MTPLHPAPVPSCRRQAGFSMVEILIGLVIAMIGVAIMMEVLLTSEQRSRTTSSGNEALSSGAVMLHMMQRDLVQAGFGLNAPRLLSGCTVVMPTGAAVPLAPVVINPPAALVPAGDPNTDTLLVFYGSDNGQPEGQEIFARFGSVYGVRSPGSFAVNDYVVAAPATCTGNLTLARVEATDASGVRVTALDPSATALYNMGRTPRVVAYAVRNGSLASCDFMVSDCRVSNAANWTAVAANVASLRAQYGRDTAPPGSADGAVDTWDQVTPANACGWARATAVRFVLVARSGQFESQIGPTGQRVCEPVTAAPRTWSGSATTPIDLTRNPDGSANDEWQCFRYRTFETVAPSRNIVWMREQAAC